MQASYSDWCDWYRSSVYQLTFSIQFDIPVFHGKSLRLCALLIETLFTFLRYIVKILADIRFFLSFLV